MVHSLHSTVFIIDDDLVVRESTAILLETQGLRSALFTTADDFLSKTENSIKGCVISDYHLKGDYNGIGLLQRMQDLCYRIPVVIVSGSLSKAASAKAEESGAYAVIDKPYYPPILIETVKSALKTNRL